MDKVCRLCLHLEENMTSIFHENYRKSNLQLQIQNLCFIEISEDDPLPKMICDNCKEKLSSIEEFRKQCEHSDIKLRQHYRVSASFPTYRSLCKVLQDAGVQTEDNIEDTLFPEHISIVIKEKNLWKDVTPALLERVDTDDEEHYKKSGCDIGELCSTNHYQSDKCLVEKNDADVEKRSSSQIENDVPLFKKKAKVRIRNKEKFKCHLCEKVYVCKKALLKHTDAHMKEESKICKVCDKAFNNGKKLAEHIKKHNIGVDLKCEVCEMPFKEQVKLNIHLRMHGKGPPINTDKQYLCDMCSSTFVSKSGLRLHLKAHSGTKPYMCRFCNKSFTIPSYRKRHELTHTGEKHFVCHICSTGFASANGLKYHVRSHTGEANYHCNTCGKSFRRFKYLKEHTYTHTGERPFVCKICGSAYGNSGSLFVHEKKCKTQYALSMIAPSKNQENDEVERV